MQTRLLLEQKKLTKNEDADIQHFSDDVYEKALDLVPFERLHEVLTSINASFAFMAKEKIESCQYTLESANKILEIANKK